jgi:CheY-like chemotaxis protein
LNSKKVLVVDDDAVFVLGLSLMLRSEGFDVLTADIMDWLRYVVGVDNTPVIFLTAADQAEHVERAKKAGAVGLFQKTVETAELMGVIHQLLD